MDVRVTNTIASATQRLPMSYHHIGRAHPRSHPVVSFPSHTPNEPSFCQEAGPMTTQQRYAMPVEPSEAIIPSRFDSLLRWEYEDGRASLLNLYEKGKERQWNSNGRIDWTQDLDPENPQELPDEQISIYGSDIWNRLTAKNGANLPRHRHARQP